VAIPSLGKGRAVSCQGIDMVDAVCDFVNAVSGQAGIGILKDALHIIEGTAGTLISLTT
tara:strand:+ start:26447 stop:26623 length:177 start_codon:yes stop_codon:yes gene_type:complete